MSEITYVVGDATNPAGDGPKLIAHIVNDSGQWGRGFVMAVSARWPGTRTAYQRWFHNFRGWGDSSSFRLGAVQFVPVGDDLEVANMVGQHGVRYQMQMSPPIRYDALASCLSMVGSRAVERRASVHMPRIGCGLAGGTWDKVEPLILEHLYDRGVPVTVYDLG